LTTYPIARDRKPVRTLLDIFYACPILREEGKKLEHLIAQIEFLSAAACWVSWH